MINQEVTPQNIEKARHLTKLLLEAQKIALELKEIDQLDSLRVHNEVNLEIAIMRCRHTIQNYQKSLEDVSNF